MNYLAHLFLAGDQPDLIVGNFLADMVKNRYQDVLPKGVLDGIRLHRQIDSFTDAHAEVKKGMRRLYADHHKYAPVVIDIFYDYLLYQNWKRYSEETMPNFKKRVYAVLLDAFAIIPEPFQARTRSMVEHDWLASYSTLEGIEYTFDRLQRKVSRPEDLEDCVVSLERDYELLNEEFNRFFPEVLEMVKAFQ
ncbi:MAG: ACP phosphodiesterase [Bacteroidota bacterium]